MGSRNAMRIVNPSQIRAAPIDRNPTDASKSVLVITAGPHTVTIRWTYTVPAARKAIVGPGSNMIDRVTAAAPAGRIGATVGNNAGTLWISDIETFGNTVAFDQSQAIGTGFLISAGYILTWGTADLSTGGTVNYTCGVAIMEYDA
jgi:hypothetical protein